MIDFAVRDAQEKDTKRGMVLPFKPLSLSFDNVNYYVDMPAVSSLYTSHLSHHQS